MFRCEIIQGAHNSGILSSPDTTSKLLVTRRSWQAKSAWNKFPSLSYDKVFRKTRSGPSSTTPNIQLGDYVDGSVSLLPRRDDSATADVDLAPDSVPPHGEPVDHIDNSEALQEFMRVHGFRFHQLAVFVFSMVTYLADVISDAYLVVSYYSQGDYHWSWLTLVLMLFPALVMTGFSLAWYALDRKAKADPPRTCRAWTLRLFFHGLQLAPLVRLADALYYGIASRRADVSLTMAVHYTQLMLYEDADSAMLRMIECFMEAAPQILLQLYIMFTQKTNEFGFRIVAQAVSCSTSWLSLAWCLTHYQSSLRSSRVEKANLGWLGTILFFTWKAFLLASRLLALSLYAALIQPLWFGLTVGFHWLLAFGWLVSRGTTFCSPQPHAPAELLFDLVLGAVYCFDVVNVREGHSRLWYLSCYSVLAIENACMVGLVSILLAHPALVVNANTVWLRRVHLSPWFNQVPIWVWPVAVIGTFGLGIVTMITYYMLAHPSGKIKVCVPCSELMQEVSSITDHVDKHPNMLSSATSSSAA